jgi:hypothetical protein
MGFRDLGHGTRGLPCGKDDEPAGRRRVRQMGHETARRMGRRDGDSIEFRQEGARSTMSSARDWFGRHYRNRPGIVAMRFYQAYVGNDPRRTAMTIDDKTRTELEAAVFRRLVEHLRQRTDVQNIDMMNLAGFCRNCLSNWMKDAADAKGVAMTKDASREVVYGMPYEEWKAKHQSEARGDQKAAFEKAAHKH